MEKLIDQPSKEPRIKVMIAMGMSEKGCFHPMIKTDGNKQRNDTNNPFSIDGNLIVVVEMKKPATTHIVNAERLASQVSFCTTMGITSRIPAIQPNSRPIRIRFIVIKSLGLLLKQDQTQSNMLSYPMQILRSFSSRCIISTMDC